MRNTTRMILAVLLIGTGLTPLLRHKPRPGPALNSPALPQEQAPFQTEVASSAGEADATIPSSNFRPPSLQERVAALPPLTFQQIETYVNQNRTNAESLMAAYRVTSDRAWLMEAASRYPNHPDVQYAVIATRASPEAQRQWIDAYKASSPDNALGFYLSALDHFKTGQRDLALQELAEATRKPACRTESISQLQALEELNLSGGRTADEAKFAAFQTVAQSPELAQVRELAKTMSDLMQQCRQQGDSASAGSLANMGLVLGAHLSDGGASQSVINQLVGTGIQKNFLQQLEPGDRDPFGRSATEALAAIEQRQAALKEYSQMMQRLTGRLEDREWALYMERVKLYGEESALAWLKSKHDQR